VNVQKGSVEEKCEYVVLGLRHDVCELLSYDIYVVDIERTKESDT
jgi:hypothetical protein